MAASWIDRPWVTVHYAQTLDGRIATRSGDSQWISSQATLRLAHQLRAEHQAVMVGVGTVVADDPRLTVRLVPGASPRRIIVDSTLRLPLHARVLRETAGATLIATTARASHQRREAVRRLGAEVLVVDQDDHGRVDLARVLQRLATLDIASVLIEGGQSLVTSALQQRLVDRLIVCIAPKILGQGIDSVGDLRVCHLADAITFEHARFTPLGQDLVFDGRLRR